jgi:asparagine synthetase B (glutamine-hydrolysing)
MKNIQKTQKQTKTSKPNKTPSSPKLTKDYKNIKLDQVAKINSKKPKVVLLYSGGLDTSNILK